MKASILFVIAFLCTANDLRSQAPENGRDLIRAMYERYDDQWYSYLKFKQQTRIYDINTGRVARRETWYESMKIPGQLGIKIDDPAGGNGILFYNNVQYGFSDGSLVQEVPRVHDLLVLGFDVYRQHPDSSISALERVGYDLDKMYEDTWRGREVYVVGTNLPDHRVAQFWIDKERLLFLRYIKPGRQNTAQEVQFNKYERLGNAWIAPEVLFKVNGRLSIKETYFEITLPDSISEDFFDPSTFVRAEW